MRIFITLLISFSLFSCAPQSYQLVSGGYSVGVDPFAMNSRAEIEAFANEVCKRKGQGYATNLKKNAINDWTHDCSGRIKNSNSSENQVANVAYIKKIYSGEYNDSSPKLFYDRNTGGMRECNNIPLTGNCVSFKSYNPNAYNANTLFYDSNTSSMRPCIGSVTFNGKCTAFGLYRSGMASKNQLFYDERNNKMTTCNFVTISGKCSAFDLIPTAGSTGGSYNIDSASNPYYKKVPKGSGALMKSGMDMLGGNCTLGLNC